jgi:hypothetical protein
MVASSHESGQRQRVGTKRRRRDLGRSGARIRRSDGRYAGKKRARTRGSGHGIMRGTHRENVSAPSQADRDLACQKVLRFRSDIRRLRIFGYMKNLNVAEFKIR